MINHPSSILPGIALCMEFAQHRAAAMASATSGGLGNSFMPSMVCIRPLHLFFRGPAVARDRFLDSRGGKLFTSTCALAHVWSITPRAWPIKMAVRGWA